MPTTTDHDPMAKESLVSVKLKASVYRKVRTIASWKGVNVAEYLSDIVAPVADKDFERMKREEEKLKSEPEDE